MTGAMSEDEKTTYSDWLTLVGEANNPRYIEYRDKAQCVPLTDTGMVILIVEPSPAYGDEGVLYLPGGGIEPDESPLEAANRELQEEIGYKARRLDFLGELRPWVKHLRHSVYVHLARELTPSKLHGDEIHNIITELVPLNDFERVIATGRLHDSSVIAALYMARHFVQQEEDTLP
ncbi:MAG: NUDIX domain-containing protein [bacterium]|nr:NUDIX domain-containing protein [bacterium]